MSEFESAWLREYPNYEQRLRERKIAANSKGFVEFLEGFGVLTLKTLFNQHAATKGYAKLPPSPPGHPNIIDQKLAELIGFLGTKFEEETGQLGGRTLLEVEQRLRALKKNLFD